MCNKQRQYMRAQLNWHTCMWAHIHTCNSGARVRAIVHVCACLCWCENVRAGACESCMCVHAYADVQVNACGCAQLEVCAGACESSMCALLHVDQLHVGASCVFAAVHMYACRHFRARECARLYLHSSNRHCLTQSLFSQSAVLFFQSAFLFPICICCSQSVFCLAIGFV